MPERKFSTLIVGILAIIAMTFVLDTGAWAQLKYKRLHSFRENRGISPAAGLIFDAAGNLYGTTSGGSTGSDSSVFELAPNPDGGWTWSMIANLGGAWTFGGLVFDTAGDLYGTTAIGGLGNPYEFGSIFELVPDPGGTWTMMGLPATLDVNYPEGLAIDSMGNLYGTYSIFVPVGECEQFECGAVFELTQNSDGTWTNTTLYSFSGGNDGALPDSVPVLDAAGNIYGTTSQAGAYGYGTIWQLKPQEGGGWAEYTLYAFNNGRNGGNPQAGLSADAAGNFYCTTSSGGAYGYGTVFMVGLADRQIHVLHQFTGGKDGANPNGTVVVDASGNVYGATPKGGAYSSGVVFKLIPSSGGRWTEQVLHQFTGGSDGAGPNGGLIFDSSGNLYGTTYGGGINDNGVVFEITP